MKIVCFSDTHGHHRELDSYFANLDADVVIHAGDAGNSKDKYINSNEIQDFLEWYDTLNVPVKIFVPGNHDTSMEAGMIDKSLYPTVNILIHDKLSVDGTVFFGSPYTPTFGIGWAYNKARNKINRAWESIPDDVDVLITHGPPLGILDKTSNGVDCTDYKNFNTYMLACGDSSLLKKVIKSNIKCHIFGHIHNESNIINNGVFTTKGKTFINASIVDLRHHVVNLPHIIDI